MKITEILISKVWLCRGLNPGLLAFRAWCANHYTTESELLRQLYFRYFLITNFFMPFREVWIEIIDPGGSEPKVLGGFGISINIGGTVI